MPETLTLNLTPRSIPPEKYWIALQQIVEPEEATIEEAAEIIDEAFALDPCVSAEDKDELQPEDEPSWEEKIEAALERYEKFLTGRQESICPSADGCFTVQVKLFRSHQARPYTLLPQGCTITQTITGNVEAIRRNVAVQNATALSLDLPADQPISASWSGPCHTGAGRLETNPEITSNRGRVYWDAAVDGVIALSYSLPYELLTIETDSEDAALTALYHLAVDQITLEPPHVDDAAEDLCEQIKNKLTPLNPDETGSCLAETLYRWLCDCSGKTADLKRVHTDVPCPEGVAPGNIVSRQDVVSYISCPAEEDEVNDPDYYLDKCCTPWPFYPDHLPRCRKRTRTWSGKGLDPERKKEILRAYPGAQIVIVGPDPAPCGVITYEQDVNARNCCDGVTQLLWNYEESGDVVDINSFVDVYVSGGTRPIAWKVRGIGFWTNPQHTQRDAVTTGGILRIYTDENACGTAVVNANDGCSQVSEYIRSIAGEWKSIDPVSVPFRKLAADTFTGNIGAPSVGCGRGYAFFEATRGKYKVQQHYLVTTESSETNYSTTCAGACAGVSDDWQALIGAAKAKRAGMPNNEPELIDMDDAIHLVEYSLVILPAYWDETIYGAPIQRRADAIGVVHACKEPDSPVGCRTIAAVLVGQRDGDSTCTTGPLAWEWVCYES